MKKKQLLFMLGMSAYFTTCIAVEREVSWADDPGRGTKSNTEIPSVRYDDDHVTISADTLLTEVKVKITDSQGQVMSSHVMELTPGTPITLFTPDSSDNKKQTVEIFIDKNRYFGYFE